MKKFKITSSVLILILVLLLIYLNQHIPEIYANKTNINSFPDNNSVSTGSDNSVGTIENKVVILTFGDIAKTQYTNARPILNSYGFKGSFFVTCKWVSHPSETNNSRMNWQEIQSLYNEGHDIESKTMTHRDLNRLSNSDLEFEVGYSKKCLADHGIKANIFAVPHGDAWHNTTVINIIAKYYPFADNGFANLMFLDCNGYNKTLKHTDCRTYSADTRLNYINRYSITEHSHNSWDQAYNHDDKQIFLKFVEQVTSQTQYNKNGGINAIPIVAYHSIDDNKMPFSTNINLFAAEMKYLHDNGFRIVTMDKIAYDINTDHLYLLTN